MRISDHKCKSSNTAWCVHVYSLLKHLLIQAKILENGATVQEPQQYITSQPSYGKVSSLTRYSCIQQQQLH